MGSAHLGRAAAAPRNIHVQRPADLLVATLGKAFGVNGGYVVGEEIVIRYLRETSPFYIYSNPITPAEAAAAHKAIDIVDSPDGAALTRAFAQDDGALQGGA